jgi:hypothetical protein
MAKEHTLTDEDYFLMEYDAFIREVEKSGIPLWVYHAYYTFSLPRMNGDMANQFNESQEFDNLFDDEDQILGI